VNCIALSLRDLSFIQRVLKCAFDDITQYVRAQVILGKAFKKIANILGDIYI
jgi:hypothetical protein